jgi:hypothetical protein
MAAPVRNVLYTTSYVYLFLPCFVLFVQCLVIVSFMYIYSYLFWLDWCKDYCHPVKTQLQSTIILTCLLTPWSSPSWEANRFAASQEIPRVLLNPKVHYRIHNCSPPVLSQPNPVHNPASHFLKIHPNIIFPPTPGPPQWLLSLRFSHKNLIHASLLLHPRYMPILSHFSWFYHPENIGWGIQIKKLLIMKFSQLPCYLVPHRPKYCPQHSILKHPQSTFLPQNQRPSFTPIQNNRQN